MSAEDSATEKHESVKRKLDETFSDIAEEKTVLETIQATKADKRVKDCAKLVYEERSKAILTNFISYVDVCYNLEPTIPKCPVCLENLKQPTILTGCGHVFCAECLKGLKCSMCKKESRRQMRIFLG